MSVVIRLAGINAWEAASLLNDSGLDFLVAKDLKETAEKVVLAMT